MAEEKTHECRNRCGEMLTDSEFYGNANGFCSMVCASEYEQAKRRYGHVYAKEEDPQGRFDNEPMATFDEVKETGLRMTKDELAAAERRRLERLRGWEATRQQQI